MNPSHRPHSEPRVDFVVAGTQKGGTRALKHALSSHPALCLSTSPEVHFFDDEPRFQTGSPDYAAYHSSFDMGPGHLLAGDVTPIYMYWRDAPGRIWRYNPAIKVIVSLRNPIERAFSHWNMERSRACDPVPFGEAIRQERTRCREALPLQHRVFSYVDRGFYTEQLRRIWSFFSPDQVLVLRNEELRLEPQRTLDRVFRFLGVESVPVGGPLEVHHTPYATEMSGEDWLFLAETFELEIRALERALGWDCRAWLVPPSRLR